MRSISRHANKPLLAAVVVLAGIGVSSCGFGPGTQEPSVSRAMGQPEISRLVRVSGSQYTRIIADVFGPTISTAHNPNQGDARIGGLLAIGAAQVSYSAAGFSSAHDLAEDVAQQVTDPAHRDMLIPCQPANDQQPDDACAQQFFAKVGRLLWRRALAAEELTQQVQAAHESAAKLNDFYAGMRESLTAMLASPNFLFRVLEAGPMSGEAGSYELTPYSKAAQLAALLWNSNPDGALLTAAETGELDSERGLAQQVDRMLASPKAEFGVRAFFADMLEFDKFAALDKDSSIYPRYTTTVGSDMEESLLRVLVDELLVNKVSYPQLFTTRNTYLTPALAAVIGVQLPLPPGASNGAPGQEWTKYEFPEGDARAGFVTMPAFTALHAHPGASSPTLRGKAIRQNLLCQKIPDPPAGVNFDLFSSSDAGPTARERLKAHSVNASCAGCHRLMDPIGLGLENFDGSGSWRTAENGVQIDTAGDLDGATYKEVGGLNQVIGKSAEVQSCLVSRVYAYGTAREVVAADKAFLKELTQKFGKAGSQYTELLKLVAMAPEFYQLTAPKGFGSQADVEQRQAFAN
jgi:hypothetical protein